MVGGWNGGRDDRRPIVSPPVPPTLPPTHACTHPPRPWPAHPHVHRPRPAPPRPPLPHATHPAATTRSSVCHVVASGRSGKTSAPNAPVACSRSYTMRHTGSEFAPSLMPEPATHRAQHSEAKATWRPACQSTASEAVHRAQEHTACAASRYARPDLQLGLCAIALAYAALQGEQLQGRSRRRRRQLPWPGRPLHHAAQRREQQAPCAFRRRR